MEDNKVLAVVEGKEITEKDLNLLMEGLGQRAIQFSSEAGRQQLINELVTQELFLLDAKANKLDQEEEFVAEFEKVRENFMKQYAITKMLQKIEVNDEEVAEYYEKHQEMYEQPEMAKASHILVETEEKAEAALKEINEGLSFADAAVKYSNCPSNMQGGDLGYFDKGKMVPEFEEAVFNMSVNDIKGPVQTQFGYHIIQLVDRKPAGTKTLEEVLPQIQNQLYAIKQNKLYFETSQQLRSQYSVEMK